MKIICLEGCHGCGKSTIIKSLAAAGHDTLDEGFLDMPKFSLAPQSFTMETMWVLKWIERSLKIHQDNPDAVYFADRSPFSVLFYAPGGEKLLPVIIDMLKDLAAVGIEIIVVYLRVDNNILWDRIQKRLLVEPERVRYKEDKIEWMYNAISFYERHLGLWDHVFNNGHEMPTAAIAAVGTIEQSHH